MNLDQLSGSKRLLTVLAGRESNRKSIECGDGQHGRQSEQMQGYRYLKGLVSLLGTPAASFAKHQVQTLFFSLFEQIIAKQRMSIMLVFKEVIGTFSLGVAVAPSLRLF